jgi:flagellar biosynthesis/type III secretory pathway protein FliH
MEKMELMDELQVHYKDFVKRMKGRVSYDDYETQSLLEGYTEELASFISKELDKAREEGFEQGYKEAKFDCEMGKEFSKESFKEVVSSVSSKLKDNK